MVQEEPGQINMTSREKILRDVKNNQLQGHEMSAIPMFPSSSNNLIETFISTLEGIGGRAFVVEKVSDIQEIVKKEFEETNWVLSLSEKVYYASPEVSVLQLENYEKLDLLIIDASLAIAENSAIWVTENEIKERVLPFITQHLAVVLKKESIVSNMHEAYEIIGEKDYGFATFIAGPSKTADIEQSLVLGAHGPKTMTVFIF